MAGKQTAEESARLAGEELKLLATTPEDDEHAAGLVKATDLIKRQQYTASLPPGQWEGWSWVERWNGLREFLAASDAPPPAATMDEAHLVDS